MAKVTDNTIISLIVIYEDSNFSEYYYYSEYATAHNSTHESFRAKSKTDNEVRLETLHTFYVTNDQCCHAT